LVSKRQFTAKDYIYCIFQNLEALDPLDRDFRQKKARAQECLKSLWELLGYKRVCKYGDLPSRG